MTDLDNQLSQAFAAWSEARTSLAELRNQWGDGQMGASPAAAALATQITQQEHRCEELFAALVAVAERRADLLEQQKQGTKARN